MRADLWIVSGTTGEYSDRTTWVVSIVDCEDDAKLFVTKLQEQYLKLPRSATHEERKTIMSLDPQFLLDYTRTTYFYESAPHLSRLALERKLGI